MAVNLQFTKDILEWRGDEIHIQEDRNMFPLDSLKTSQFPKRILDWTQSVLNKKEKNLVSLPVENRPLKGIIFWLKEGEDKFLQVNYKNLDNQNASYRVRNFFFLEKNSSLNWIECFLNSSFQSENYVFVDEGACWNQLTVNQSSSSSRVYCDLHQKSSFFSLDINLSSWSKFVQIYGREPESISIVRGLNCLKQEDQSSWFVLNQHDGVSGYSRQWYRSVLDGRSKNSIHSKVAIQAQEVNSHQMLQDLILSPYAKAENKPELEVSKDQVKATHGSTTGTPNPMEIFYMNTRGVSKEKALEFVITGWVEAVFDESDYELFNKFLKKIVPSLRPVLRDYIKTFKI